MSRLLFANKTALYALHKELGAQMTTFCNYDLPIVYKEGHLKAHHACREHAALFDVSHMLQTDIKGSDSVAFLEHLTCSDIREMKAGQALYTLILTDKNTIVDDAIVQKIDENHFYLVSNAGCRDKVQTYLRDIKQHSKFECNIAEIKRSLLALQGPKAVSIFQQIVNKDLSNLYFMNGLTTLYQQSPIRVTRCG